MELRKLTMIECDAFNFIATLTNLVLQDTADLVNVNLKHSLQLIVVDHRGDCPVPHQSIASRSGFREPDECVGPKVESITSLWKKCIGKISHTDVIQMPNINDKTNVIP